jgi:hypothetical protein
LRLFQNFNFGTASYDKKYKQGIGVYLDVPGCVSCGDNFDHALYRTDKIPG